MNDKLFRAPDDGMSDVEASMAETLAEELRQIRPIVTFKARMTAVVTQAEQLLNAAKLQLAAAEKHLEAVKAAARELE